MTPVTSSYLRAAGVSTAARAVTRTVNSGSVRVQAVRSYERQQLHRINHLHAVRGDFRALRTILRDRFSGAPAAVGAAVAVLNNVRK